MDTQAGDTVPSINVPRLRGSLIARLLAIAVGFIILTETIVFLPSMANFRNGWLMDRFDTGELLVLAKSDIQPNGPLGGDIGELYKATAIKSVRIVGAPEGVVLFGAVPKGPVLVVDFERQTLGEALAGVFETYFAPKDRIIRIVSRPQTNAAIKLEVTIAEAPLKAAMMRQTSKVLLTTLTTALIIGALVYAALADGFVRPMRRLINAIIAFSRAPQDASRSFVPTNRHDEIGLAEIAFSQMQETVHSAFRQRERLAQLGTAVSKIAHDLRHSLGAAQLVTERISMVDDPVIRATAPRLERALQRAVSLAQSTLTYGKAQEGRPQTELFYLADAIDEAASEALMGFDTPFSHAIDTMLEIEADADHVHRIFTNIIRNAAQAIQSSGKAGAISVQVAVKDTLVEVLVCDTGPGLPPRALGNLFAPFSASGLAGGSGLGLAIARDLATMGGGDVRLISTGPEGTTFAVDLNLPRDVD